MISLAMRLLTEVPAEPEASEDLILTVRIWEISSEIFSEIFLAAEEAVDAAMDRCAVPM